MATLETQQLDEVIVSSRRKMLTLGGAALAGFALTSVAKAQAALTDADYLNFALNLEYLEAQFYTLAVSGTTIDKMGVGITGPTAAGTVTTQNSNNYASCQVAFKNTLVKAYATETALEERNHVKFLRNALSTSAVAMPNIDLLNSFNGLASYAGIGPSFNPFADDISFLLGSYIFEDVGVTAYTGAAPALTVSANLDAAAGIQAVEAYHAGLIRTTIFGLDQQATTLGPAGTASAIATKISVARAKLDGSTGSKVTATNTQGNDIGLGTQQVQLNATMYLTASTLVNATTTGSINTAAAGTSAGSLAFARAAASVLNIVYAGGAAGKGGGFFPNAMNGNVK